MANPRIRDDLTEPKAIKLFKKLTAEYREKYGDISETALHLLNDIAMLEQIKQECRVDISKKGVMIEWQNGANQGGEREHPLLTKINQTTEQQRRLLNELKLTPASLKVISGNGQSGGDEFEAF